MGFILSLSQHILQVGDINTFMTHCYSNFYPSGRTIGGSIWWINYGSTDIVYAMDINLKKEIVLDGRFAVTRTAIS